MASDSPQFRIGNIIFGELSRARFSILAVVTAAIYFFSIFDLNFILDCHLWSLGHGDIGVNYLGFLFYVHDRWRFPLFQTALLGYPYGTTILLSDSVPLLALIYKIFAPLLPADFDPFGLWVFICYILLAHAFTVLLFHFGCHNALAAVAGALFALMTPFLSVHVYIASLQAQFLLVYGLLLYFRAADGVNQRRTMTLFSGLLLSSLLINFYFFVVNFILYACATTSLIFAFRHSQQISQQSSHQNALRPLGINFALTAVGILTTMFAAGYLPAPVPWTGASSYGYYSMNLLAPVSAARLGGNAFYVNLSVEPDATGGQLASFNYWGAGILLLVVATAPSWIRRLRVLFSARIWPLATGFFLITLFAVSNKVYFGHHLLFSYPLPEPVLHLANMLHSSGRLFWAVSYFVMAFVLAEGLSLKRQWLAATLVVGALVVQEVDNHVLFRTRQAISRSLDRQSIHDEAWRPIVAAHQLVVLIPPSQCGGLLEFYSEIGRIAGLADVAMHSVRPGRFGPQIPQACREILLEIAQGRFRPGTLYVFDPVAFRSIRERPELAKYCTELESYSVCTLAHDQLRLPRLESGSGPPFWPTPVGPTNARPARMEELAPLLGIGWTAPESAYVWSLGARSEILFRLHSCTDATAIRVNFSPQVGPDGQILTISANGGPPITREYREPQADELTVPIGNCNPGNPLVVLVFNAARPIAPLELVQSDDPRPLGLALREVELLR